MRAARQCVVVGAGISGLVSAILLRRRGWDVVVVDADDKPGGLLGSFRTEDGRTFDYGTHLPQEIGHEDLDRLLFSEVDRPPWRRLDHQRAGNFVFGTLNESSPFPDLHGLPDDVYRLAALDLLEADGSVDGAANAEAELRATFGGTATEALFRPVLRKLLGREIEELAPGAHRFFFARVIAFTPTTTRRLKELGAYDERLAFHDGREGASDRRSFYPTQGGAGRWVDDLIERHLTEVSFRLGHGVDRVVVEDGHGRAVVLTDGTTVPFDEAVWTTPVANFLRAIDLKPPGSGPPARLSTRLHHLEFDQPFATDLHYATCYDPELTSFRATLYPSLRGAPEVPPYTCTVEVMGPYGTDVESDRAVVVDDLRAMGLIRPSAHAVDHHTSLVREGFPIPTPSLTSDATAAVEAAEAAVDNVRFLGRSTGRAFFMPDVLRQCHEALAD